MVPPPTFMLRTRGRLVSLPRPAVMGVINVSPDSFYGVQNSVSSVVGCAAGMIQAGVSIIDIGAEATSPNVSLVEDEAVQVQLEQERLLPALEAIRERFDVLVSIDTSREAVIRSVAKVGADIINDQRALRMPGALEAVSELGLAACIMHSFRPQREAGSSMPAELLQVICTDLLERVAACEAAGVTRDRLMIDPGFGQGHYGKNIEENFYLLAHLKRLVDLDLPVLVGWSRKSQIRDFLQKPLDELLSGSLAAATIAGQLGASVIRAHDVNETVDVCRMVQGVLAHLSFDAP